MPLGTIAREPKPDRECDVCHIVVPRQEEYIQTSGRHGHQGCLAARSEVPAPTSSPTFGSTADEIHISDLIAAAFIAFCDLPPYHPDELRDVRDAVHRWQDILMARVARRTNPEHWPIKS